MAKLTSFPRILQTSIDPDDFQWNYHVPDLPTAQQLQASGLVKLVSVVSSDTKQHIILTLDNVPSNRVTRGETNDRLMLITFANFRLRWPPSSAGEGPRLATSKENGDYITRLLVGGVKLNGVHYYFYGHSNSQLKSRSCFMYAASKAEISKKIEAMGDLSKLKSAGKKAKRIGLLFSSADMALNLPPDCCEDIDDVERNDYTFTDGCGLISKHLAKELCQQRNIVYRGLRYHPSVFQIRYRGYKGVLTLDPTLRGKTLVQFRASMRKFKDATDHSFAVVEYSRPYNFGYLNDEVVVLLYALGISKETLISKQEQHLQWLRNVEQGDSRAAYQFLSYYNKLETAEKLLFQGVESVRDTLQSMVRQEHSRMLNKRDEQRCRILIPKSRLLFGVCDPHSKPDMSPKLKEGECFVRITLDGDGRPRTITNTELLVTRNPCLHPGDLQKFRAVDVPEFSHLVDCIVFPTQGKRPSADLMSGGDLDGDKFFVSWDPDIIPSVISEPAAYPGVKEAPTFKPVTDDDRAEYFARYTNTSLGRVKNLYLKWARLGNAMSPQCQQLNRLFSQCVDGNRIKVPQELEDPPEPSPSHEPFILDVLHTACTELIQSKRSLPVSEEDPDLMNLLLTRDKMAISEFELIQIALRWCRKNAVDIMQYSHFFDFSALTDEQQTWFLGQLPVSAESPRLVRNGLLQSDLVTTEEMHRFGLDHSRLHWKPVFKSSSDRLGRFTSTLCQSLELFHKKLIILRVDERLTLAVYVPSKIERSSEVQVDTNVRVFALPQSQGRHSVDYRVLPTKVNYRLYCDEGTFQLYNLKRSDTWIFLIRSQFNDAPYRNVKSTGAKRREKEKTIDYGINYDCRVSVNLGKISAEIQRHVGRLNRAGVLGAEIYVISNRDVQSMNFLDQWLQYVDTEEVLPLFERLEVDYQVPKLAHVKWEEYSSHVAGVVRDKNLSQIRRVPCIEDLETIFSLCIENDEKLPLRDIYSHVLSLEASGDLLLPSTAVSRVLLELLPRAPYLISAFFQSETWTRHREDLDPSLVSLGPRLLHNLVLSERELREFVRQPFSILLRELRRITLQCFADLVELIALTIRSPEAALDLLIEILEPETSRLLVGRPALISQFVKCVYGIALDHIDEASSSKKHETESIKLVIDDEQDGYVNVKSSLRIDSEMRSSLKVGDHVRLTASNPPQNAPLAKLYSMDAIVLKAGLGSASFRCLHRPPLYVEQCAWVLLQCGSFVTSKTMLDAVTAFYTQKEATCQVFGLLTGFPDVDQISLPNVQLPFKSDSTLNESQNAALDAAMHHSLTFIWGPPGTGKTHTVIVILTQLLNALPGSKFLVTAPTHNAVDNLLRRFLKDKGVDKTGGTPLRVSNQLSRVSPDLHAYTCDAMLKMDLNTNPKARKKAQARIKAARLVFTTCAGAGLGLLRSESFSVVLIDEASQQTEPATLVPLVKGCSRAILVGDHVQLRATVQKNAVLTGYDVSLFERYYTDTKKREAKGMKKVMLDTQYRMHRDICAFSSSEFYSGRLKTAVPDTDRKIPASLFPWPEASGEKKNMVWIECHTSEDLATMSKANKGQAELCKRVVELLNTAPPTAASSTPAPSIAVLTPYTRQVSLLTSALPASPQLSISSIDAFQGREADIVVLVTVRCNAHGEMGFLTDMRRLNVAVTRAKRGLVVIGNRATLTGGGVKGLESEDRGREEESRGVWKRLVERCVILEGLEGVGEEGVKEGQGDIERKVRVR